MRVKRGTRLTTGETNVPFPPGPEFCEVHPDLWLPCPQCMEDDSGDAEPARTYPGFSRVMHEDGSWHYEPIPAEPPDSGDAAAECGYECPYTEAGHAAHEVDHAFQPKPRDAGIERDALEAILDTWTAPNQAAFRWLHKIVTGVEFCADATWRPRTPR